MDNLTYILKRIEAGASVRFLIDYYGQETVEVERGWFRGRARLRLNQDETERLKLYLRNRRRRPEGEHASIGQRFLRLLSSH